MAIHPRGVLVLLVLPVAVGAQDWIPYATSEHGDKGFLDRSTLEVDGDRRRIWTMLEKVVPVTLKGELLKTWMARVEVHCKERTHRSLHEVGYRPDGVMFYEVRFEEKERPIVEQTMGQIRLEAICGLR